MGLSTLMMVELCKRIAPGSRIASMGYPDIVGHPKEVERILGTKIYKLKYRGDSEQIGKWHGVTHKIPDAYDFFSLLGAELEVFDVAQHRGGEIVCDLNKMGSTTAWDRRCDFVLDIGTMEHCFNIGEAAINMAYMLDRGGVIFHENPYNWGNHGFYNINPTWYHDFYSQPGFELLDMQMVVRNAPDAGKLLEDVPKTQRFKYMQSEANMFAVARRAEVLAIGYPVQTKYAKMIPAAGVPGDKEMAHG